MHDYYRSAVTFWQNMHCGLVKYTRQLMKPAVMGSICRHEIPLRFFNFCHGEGSANCNACVKFHCYFRSSYAVLMMESLDNKYPNQNFKLLYDISFTLQSHLEVCVCWYNIHAQL